MNIAHALTKLTTAALMSGAVTVASMALGPGTADAKPFYWCPGDPPIMGAVQDASGHTQMIPIQPAWDTSVCHDYFTSGDHVREGKPCLLPQFQWFQCPPGTIPLPNTPTIPNVGE